MMYKLNLDAAQMVYLLDLIDQDLQELAELNDANPGLFQDRIQEVRERRDYIQAVYNGEARD